MTVPQCDPGCPLTRRLVRRCVLLERELKEATEVHRYWAGTVACLLHHVPGGTVIRVPTQAHADLLAQAINLLPVSWWLDHPAGLDIQIGPPT